MSEAGTQAVLGVESGEELLEEDEAGIGGELLILESHVGESVEFTVHGGPLSFTRVLEKKWWCESEKVAGDIDG